MRDKVFISYSRADQRWLDRLKVHLEPYVKAGSVSYWDDRKIKAGQNWKDEINAAMRAAKVAVLLVTPDFLASDFIQNHELPYLHAAAQKKELTIIWVAVEHSAYAMTLLAGYQPANDSRAPLAALKHHERERVFAEMCEKVESALKATPPADQHPAGKRASRKNPFAHKQCNRTQYLRRCQGFLNESLEQHTGLPLVYIVHGRRGECHDTFTERLYLEVIKPYAEREAGRGQRNAIRRSKNDLDWPEHDAAMVHLQEEIQGILSLEFTGMYKINFPAADLAALPLLSKFRFTIVQHTIHLVSWTQATKALIGWYLNTYWGSLATPPATGKRPQLIVVLKITYPEPGLSSLVPYATFDPDAVKKDLEEVSTAAGTRIPVLLLAELIPPPYTEVLRWMTNQKIFQDEEDRVNAARSIYLTHGEKVTMALIEKELGKTLNSEARRG